MTVTNTAYTTNSYKVTVSSEVSSTNIVSGVDTAITTLGWTQYDVIATTTFSSITTYVYRAINADATTYKYLIIRWDLIKLQFFTSTCENWNNTTHVATNESWNGSGAFPQGYDIKDCFIWIGARDRHIAIWSFIKNEPGIWTMVMEFERVAGEDTAASNVPCWAWTNSLILGTPWGGTLNTTISQIMFAFPRTADNNTGASAAKIYAPVTSRGMYPPSYPSGTLAITVDANLLHLASFYNMTYGWDTSKTLVSPVSADAISKSMPVGRAYNVSVTKSIGSFLDSTLINADSTGGWASSSGSNTEMVILPLNGGSEVDAAYATSKNTAIYSQAGTAVTSKCIAIGDIVWAAASDGIRTWTMASGQGSTTALVYSNASGVFDIVFDGLQTIYGSTATGIVKIDTESLGTTTISTITGGTSYLGIDNKYVYAVDRAASTTPKCYMINRSTFTVNAGAYTSGTALTVASGLGTPVPDYSGAVYVASTAGTTASQTLRLSSFSADTGTQLLNVPNILRSVAATLQNDSPTSFYIDYTSGRIYLFIAAAGSGSIYEINSSLVALQTVSSASTAATGAPSSSQLNYTGSLDYRGDLNIVPIRGMFFVGNKKVGIATVTSGWCTRVHWNYPSATTPGIPFVSTNNASVGLPSTPLGYAATMTHNGVRTFASYCQTLASDNRIYYISNYYNATTISGSTAGRLLIKG